MISNKPSTTPQHLKRLVSEVCLFWVYDDVELNIFNLQSALRAIILISKRKCMEKIFF